MAVDAAVLSGRVLAFVVACVAFYLAFFLYEDEEGVLRNRIDDLWIAVHDRARVTDSLSTALFNRIAHGLSAASNVVFGEALLSLRMFAVSTNVSLGGAVLVLAVLGLAILGPTSPQHFEGSLECLALSLMFIGLAALVVCFPRRWVAAIACLPFWCALCLMVVFASAWSQSAAAELGRAGVILFQIAMESLLPALVLSLISDALVLAAIRKLFSNIATSLTLGRILRSIGLLVAILLVIVPLPLLAPALLGKLNHEPGDFVIVGAAWLAALNVVTALYCLIPVFALMVVLGHRVIWPALSRLIYPFTRFGILVNRKAMAGVGSLGLAIALDLEHVGLREILKLLS
jgi:hypothetical protein